MQHMLPQILDHIMRSYFLIIRQGASYLGIECYWCSTPAHHVQISFSCIPKQWIQAIIIMVIACLVMPSEYTMYTFSYPLRNNQEVYAESRDLCVSEVTNALPHQSTIPLLGTRLGVIVYGSLSARCLSKFSSTYVECYRV